MTAAQFQNDETINLINPTPADRTLPERIIVDAISEISGNSVRVINDVGEIQEGDKIVIHFVRSRSIFDAASYTKHFDGIWIIFVNAPVIMNRFEDNRYEDLFSDINLQTIMYGLLAMVIFHEYGHIHEKAEGSFEAHNCTDPDLDEDWDETEEGRADSWIARIPRTLLERSLEEKQEDRNRSLAGSAALLMYFSYYELSRVGTEALQNREAVVSLSKEVNQHTRVAIQNFSNHYRVEVANLVDYLRSKRSELQRVRFQNNLFRNSRRCGRYTSHNSRSMFWLRDIFQMAGDPEFSEHFLITSGVFPSASEYRSKADLAETIAQEIEDFIALSVLSDAQLVTLIQGFYDGQ